MPDHERIFVNLSYLLGYLLGLLGLGLLIYGLGEYGAMFWPLGAQPPAFSGLRTLQGVLLGTAGTLWSGWAAETLKLNGDQS